MPDDAFRIPGARGPSAVRPPQAPPPSPYATAHDPYPRPPHAQRGPLDAPPPHDPAPGTPPSPFPPPPAAQPPDRMRVVVADDNPVVRAGLGVLLSGRPDIEVVAEASDGRQAYDLTVAHRPDVVLLDVRMPGVDGISALPHLVGIAPVLMLTYSREKEIVQEALRLGAGGYLVHGEFTADQLVQAVRDTKDGRAHFTPTAANALLAHMRQGAPPGRGPLPEGLGTALTTGVLSPAPRAAGTGETPVGSPRQPRNSEGLSQLQPFVGQSSVTGTPAVPGSNRQQYKLSSREVEIMELIASGMSNQQIAATCFISEKTVKNHINRIFTKLHSGSRSEAIARWLGTAPPLGSGPQGGR
ncbi:response regulator transcription factor [uncultured Streptomyces sp.]|uniref:response regulator transcription factor n=1 Tax=uncultured Streptomyces sp. TaxID=174707 RepID=UPI0026067139|nr:response regulator transcription factor [uncultured Streptomyces sp.]